MAVPPGRRRAVRRRPFGGFRLRAAFRCGALDGFSEERPEGVPIKQRGGALKRRREQRARGSRWRRAAAYFNSLCCGWVRGGCSVVALCFLLFKNETTRETEKRTAGVGGVHGTTHGHTRGSGKKEKEKNEKYLIERERKQQQVYISSSGSSRRGFMPPVASFVFYLEITRLRARVARGGVMRCVMGGVGPLSLSSYSYESRPPKTTHKKRWHGGWKGTENKKTSKDVWFSRIMDPPTAGLAVARHSCCL